MENDSASVSGRIDGHGLVVLGIGYNPNAGRTMEPDQPLFGIWAMLCLRQSPDAAKLAGGRG
jgi:hypothetical protein